MKRKNRKPIQVDPETHDFFKELAREISQAQNFDVKLNETLRRTKNLPNLKLRLIEDAKAKRRLGK